MYAAAIPDTMNARGSIVEEKPLPATPDVALSPPMLYGGALALGLLLGRGSPCDERGALLARACGLLCLAAGAGIGATTIATLKRAGTNLSPYKPTTALATDGPFRLSRNPGYVAATSLYLGVALLCRSLPALTFLPIVLAQLDHYVVEREERYLEALFGDAYRAYYARVPRWF